MITSGSILTLTLPSLALARSHSEAAAAAALASGQNMAGSGSGSTDDGSSPVGGLYPLPSLASNSSPVLVQRQPEFSHGPPPLPNGHGHGQGLKRSRGFGAEVPDREPTFHLAFDPNFPFDSESANLEYSILSSLLSDGGEVSQRNEARPEGWDAQDNTRGYYTSPVLPDRPIVPSPEISYASAFTAQSYTAPQRPSTADSSALTPRRPSMIGDQAFEPLRPFAPLDPPSVPSSSRRPNLPTNGSSTSMASSSSAVNASGVGGGNSYGPNSHNDDIREYGGSSIGMRTPADVYKNVTKPYCYTEGYHFLIKYLMER